MATPSHILKWEKLLSADRLKTTFSDKTGKTDVEPRKDSTIGSRTAFEADYGRVIFSAATRRLAGKTQVHPFPSIDFVHNRLTHSLEVSNVAYSLYKELIPFFKGTCKLSGNQLNDISWILRTAALAHDLGNPPYGHAGEYAIRQWARNVAGKQILPPGIYNDFCFYDGNAQTFRLLSRSDLRDSTYFRLTLATLGAGVKYPCIVDEISIGKPKFAAFSSERDVFDFVMEQLGLKASGGYCRHPLSYLVEAADDICYLLADLEDAIVLNVLDVEQVKKLTLNIFTKDEFKEFNLNEQSPTQFIRARAIDKLVSVFSEAFRKHYDDIMSGELKESLDNYIEDQERNSMNKWRDEYKKVFKTPTKVVSEIGAYEEFSILFNKYVGIMEHVGTDYDSLDFLTKRLIDLAWNEQFYNDNKTRTKAWWAHTILDFVTGMTDRYIHTLAEQFS